MSNPEVTKIFTDLIKQWRAAESQRTIFGVEMPQTKNAIKVLLESFEGAFDIFPSFSLVKKDQAMEIVVKLDDKDEQSAEANIPAIFPSMPKVFNELNIDSVTIESGVTADEMKELFTGISKNASDIKAQGGLKGYLQAHNVAHISIDQMRFKLLKDGEEGEALAPSGDIFPKSKPKEKAADAKQRDHAWKEFLEGKIGQQAFGDQYGDFVRDACRDPKQVEKVLKKHLAKQKEAEKLFAEIEQKLTAIGFAADDVQALKKKLFKPKKVMIDEDELARLRKIEEVHKESGKATDSDELIKAMKKRLADETARAEAIMHQLGEGGMILDKAGRIISVNAAAQKVLGQGEKDILGKTVQDVLKPYHIMTAVADWQKESDEYIPKGIKVKALSDETLAIIRESAIVIADESGRSIGVLSALQNVIQQEDLSRRKNDILDVLGHDLRAPLAAVKMNFDILKETTKLESEGTEQQKRFLNNCHNSIVRMANLIEKILDTRQLETGKIMLKYDTVQTNNLLEQAVTSQNEWAKNKNITLNIQAPALPDIEGDPERLYQVITNLVSNALKFTPEGGTITGEGKLINDQGKDFVEISVKDTGMGIAKENLQRIFDKYEQVTVNAPKGVRGLGLGLSISKTIVEIHRGRIWVESEPERGSTFSFRIPVKRTEGP